MLFDSTLRRDLLRTFGATLVVILTIALTMFLIRVLGQAALGKVSPQDVVLLLGYLALDSLSTMVALSLFVSVVITMGRMYRESEMTIWFASGLSLHRFVKPVLQTSGPVLLVVILLSLLVLPWANQQRAHLADRFERRSDLSRVVPGQFQASSDGRRVFFIDRDGEEGASGRNVFILSTESDSESVTSARSGRVEYTDDGTFLVLDQGQRNEQNTQTQETTVARFENYRVLISTRAVKPSDITPSRARTTLDLLRAADANSKGELTWRLGLILGSANLVLLGIGLSASNPRRANNWNLLFALLTFVVYYNLITLSQAWVMGGKFGMGVTLLATHGGALALAIGLIWWRDNGAHISIRLHTKPRMAPG